MKICVFCSANDCIDHELFAMTEELGRWIAAKGHMLVFGGCAMGLMECVAKAVRENGGMAVGVVPSKIEENGRLSDNIDVHIPCDNLSDRKELMATHSDVFIALPGGIGTLDEIFTIAASATIGYHHKPLILYNMKGYWDGLTAILDGMQQRGFVRGAWREHIKVAGSIGEIEKILGL